MGYRTVSAIYLSPYGSLADLLKKAVWHPISVMAISSHISVDLNGQSFWYYRLAAVLRPSHEIQGLRVKFLTC